MSSDEELRIKATKRAEEKIGFYYHLGSYVGVNIFLFLIWYYWTSHVFPWFLVVLLGWGIGVVGHFFTVFYTGYTKRLAEKEYEKLKKKKT